MKGTHLSVEDVVAWARQRDTALVLPSLPHATAWWPKVLAHVDATYGRKARLLRTTIVLHPGTLGATELRLWVPYDRDPTMPLDYAQLRNRDRDYVTLFDKSVFPRYV